MDEYMQSTRAVMERMMEDYPVFSTEEEFAVRDKYKDTNPEKLKDIMFKHNVGLVLIVVPKFKRKDDDTLQVGLVGLQHAVNKFDWSRKVKFSSYAVPTIKGSVFRALKPDLVALRSFSLDAPVHSSKDDGSCSFGDIVDGLVRPEFKRYDTENSIKAFDAKTMLNKIHSRVKRMIKPKYLKIVRELYANGRNNTTLEEVGKKFGICREHVRQIEAKYLRCCRIAAGKIYGNDWYTAANLGKLIG